MDITLGQGFPVPGDSGPGGLGAEWAGTLREGEDSAGELHTTMWQQRLLRTEAEHPTWFT